MNSSSRPSIVRRATAGVLLCLSVPALSSCANPFVTDHEQESTYAKASDMDLGTFELQNWIPRSATDVKIKISTTAQARPITSFTLDEEELPGACEQTSTTPSGPQLDAEWMPEDAAADATLMCGDFAVVTDGGTILAWDTRAPEAAAAPTRILGIGSVEPADVRL